MRISEKIAKYVKDTEYEIINEQPVESLGFLSCTEVTECAFAGAAKFLRRVNDNVKMIIIPEDLKNRIGVEKLGMIVTEDPQRLFWDLHQNMAKDGEYIRETKPNQISDSAKIGKYVSMGEYNVTIEDGVEIEDFVTIYPNTHIRKNSKIRSGCRIGGIGFQEYKYGNEITTINHYGGVLIGENVEIQNNSSVNRALFPWENTCIGDETKVDGCVQISHASQIGKRCEIASGAVIAGRTIVGEDVWIGLCACVRNSLKIGDHSRINIGSVVVSDVPEGASVSGNYAIDHNQFLYTQLKMRRN